MPSNHFPISHSSLCLISEVLRHVNSNFLTILIKILFTTQILSYLTYLPFIYQSLSPFFWSIWTNHWNRVKNIFSKHVSSRSSHHWECDCGKERDDPPLIWLKWEYQVFPSFWVSKLSIHRFFICLITPD